MIELIAELPYRVLDSSGTDYYVSVAGEQRADGRWEAWLEYVPGGESEPLQTDIETTQTTRADVVRWAETLTETYVQGAFDRAAVVAAESRLVARRADAVVAAAAADVAADAFDPFELYEQGTIEMRRRLAPLTRSELLAIIDAFGLNPAQKSLAWLSQSQLVTFIVTATDVQVKARVRR
jgi:hypothetical protein